MTPAEKGVPVACRDAEEPKSVDHLLAQVSRLHRGRVHSLVGALGLHRGQPQLLFALWEEDGLTHSQLAERMMVTPATISRMVQRMEKTGFLTRRVDPTDERVSRVYLSPAGREVQAALRQVWRTMEEETFAGLSDEELAALSSLLGRLRDNLQRVSGEIPPP